METQMEEWYKEAGQLQSQVATIPQQTQVKESVAGRQAVVEARMVRLIEPLKERRRLLLASKEVHQVRRDLEDEIVSVVEIRFFLFWFLSCELAGLRGTFRCCCGLQLWIQERLPMAMCQEHGSTLQEVQQLMKKNQVKEKSLSIPKYIYF